MEAGVEVTQLTLAGAEHGFLNRNSVNDPHANQTITLMADFVNGGAK
jgi:acetyl esterase/lipase